jgi:hypothetical protein
VFTVWDCATHRARDDKKGSASARTPSFSRVPDPHTISYRLMPEDDVRGIPDVDDVTTQIRIAATEDV